MLSIFAEPISEVGVPQREKETHLAPLFEDAPRLNKTVDREEPELPAETPETPDEFEIVLGRRQIASVLFVATVILAVLSAVSYLAGKSISPKKEMPAVPAVAALAGSRPTAEISPTVPTIDANIAPSVPPPATPATKAAQSPVLKTPARSEAPAALPEVSMEAPMFAEPAAGAMYLQMGAVDKGAAAIFAEGLRKRGFPSFVATGPNATLFRVLIGPLRDTAAYARTKDALDRMGVNTFGRTYEK
jgi:cell division protein FtsN